MNSPKPHKKDLEEKEKKDEFDPQAAFEEAIENRSQVAIIKREHDHYFQPHSVWRYKERNYKVYMVLNAGQFVKVGFMPVKEN